MPEEPEKKAHDEPKADGKKSWKLTREEILMAAIGYFAPRLGQDGRQLPSELGLHNVDVAVRVNKSFREYFDLPRLAFKAGYEDQQEFDLKMGNAAFRHFKQVWRQYNGWAQMDAEKLQGLREKFGIPKAEDEAAEDDEA